MEDVTTPKKHGLPKEESFGKNQCQIQGSRFKEEPQGWDYRCLRSCEAHLENFLIYPAAPKGRFKREKLTEW